MATRNEAAAATREALVLAASELLDAGGPDAVTLRAVGARAGVTRGAPYGHFANKEHLLTHLAIGAWNSLTEAVGRLREAPHATAGDLLERALVALIEVGRRQPHLYALMFSAPVADPEAAAAAERLEGLYLTLVADVVGETDAHRYGALLMSGAHGIAGMEASGHLAKPRWDTDGDRLVGMLIKAIRADIAGGDPAASAPSPG